MRSLPGHLKAKLVRSWSRYRPQRLVWWLAILGIWPCLVVRYLVKRSDARRHNQPRRIAIAHLGGIGDTLMMTPAVRILKQHFPDARIDLALTHHYVKNAFENHTYFQEIIPIEYNIQGYLSFRQVSSRTRAILQAFRYFPHLYLKLALRQYDTAIVYALSSELENLGGALVYAASVPIRIGFGENQHGFFHRSLPLNLQEVHRVDLYLELLPLLGISLPGDVDYRYVFPLSQEDHAWAKTYLEKGNPLKRPLLAIQPGGADLAVPRRWPAQYFLDVAQWLVTATGGTILLTGGPDDWKCCAPIASALGDRVVNTCGQLSIRQTAALLARCDVCLTNDTGTLHLAAAVGVPDTVAIFGPTDPRLLVPKGQHVRCLQAGMACISCAGSVINSDTQRCQQPIEGECLRRIIPEQVIQEIWRVLAPCNSDTGETCVD